MMVRDTFCSFCGTKYADASSYPRSCSNCQTKVWANPIPVSVVLLPVERNGKVGLLTIRRGIEPGKGKLALVGGFLEEHETWQEGGARELFEETGAKVDATTLTPFWFTSTQPKPNRVLLFSEARQVSTIEPFTPDKETLERGLIYGPAGLDEVFAFGLHVEAARKWFAARNITGPHAFEPF